MCARHSLCNTFSDANTTMSKHFIDALMMNSVKGVLKMRGESEDIQMTRFADIQKILDDAVQNGNVGPPPVSYTHLTLPTIYSV